MSEALFLKQAYVNVNAPLKNGLGRFIPQLMRITLKFCKEKPSSANVREFIEKDIVEFAKQNPGTAIYLKPRRNREPVVVAEYLNGERLHQSFHKLNYAEVQQWMDFYRNHSGKNHVVQKKYEFTENPTVQGMWFPFVHSDPKIATAKFPIDEIRPLNAQKSASQHLIELYQEHKNLTSIPEPEKTQLESTKQTS